MARALRVGVRSRIDSIATAWATFERRDPSLAVGLLEQIRAKTADAWVVVEPQPDETRRGLFRGKAKSTHSATISPFADDDEPHFLIYITFPKGAVFNDRGASIPDWAVLDDESKDDAMVRVPISTSVGDTIGLAMAALDGCSESPLGDLWRTAIGDAYVSPFTN